MPIQQPCLADIEPLFSPLTAMRIANPIYDSVFKFLMENELIARGLIGRLIGLEIVELTPQPQEVTERKAARLGDDQSTLRVAAKRINITLPERVLDAIDRFADASGETRSGLLARAATEYIGRAGDKSLPTAKRGRRKFKTQGVVLTESRGPRSARSK